LVWYQNESVLDTRDASGGEKKEEEEEEKKAQAMVTRNGVGKTRRFKWQKEICSKYAGWRNGDERRQSLLWS
jgi:hypothetical protein